MSEQETTTKARMGRPLKFNDPEALRLAIDEYFEKTPDIELTITGLALALDFTSRRQLIEYAERPDFHNTIKAAKTRIENSYERSLRANGRAGDIFGLKNFGWADRFENENRNQNVNLDTTELEDDELYAKLDRLEQKRGAGVPGAPQGESPPASPD